MLKFKKDPIFIEFKKYWDAYPKRKDGSKGDLYTCYLWFKAEKPDDDTKVEMMKWMAAKQENMIYFQKKGEFYSPPKDMQRWLRDYGWMTPIDKVVSPEHARSQVMESRREENEDVRMQEYRDAWAEDFRRMGMAETKRKCIEADNHYMKLIALEVWGDSIRQSGANLVGEPQSS